MLYAGLRLGEVLRLMVDDVDVRFDVQTPSGRYLVRDDSEWKPFKDMLMSDVGVQLMDSEEAHVWVFDLDREHDLGVHFWAVEGEK